MTAVQEEAVLSPVLDAGDVPLTEDLALDGEAYARIMRRIGVQDAVVPVSAFNSSI